IAFKAGTTGACGGTFEKMFHYYSFKRDEYLAHYHKRSNVESTFSMVKRKFGGEVRSKTDDAMVNEVFCKLVAHNLCVLVQEEHELGIESVFRPAKPETAVVPARYHSGQGDTESRPLRLIRNKLDHPRPL